MDASEEKYVRFGDRPSYLDHTEEIDVLLHGTRRGSFETESIEGFCCGSLNGLSKGCDPLLRYNSISFFLLFLAAMLTFDILEGG